MVDLPRMTQKETMILGLHFLAIFLIPYLPRSILILTDNIFVRVGLLAGLIRSAYISPVNAVASFVVIAMLFVERNNMKMRHLERAMQQSGPDSPAIQSIETPDTAPEQPPFEQPTIRGMPFMPQEDSGDDSFAPVAESMNQKQPLPTEGSNDGSEKAIEQLFSWVKPELAQAP